ncbi:hypothetical protein BDV98DRAFT_603259 [Pterulicium gracile]|uniref:SET domain-containing protein n=1 Tax=Pterulicium gracile TaxID=1884261 RepID=A0A5C3QX12_9AGAR|nr:hypothetical protein BDV98DRAFT_603259 [Pterula gracilis]
MSPVESKEDHVSKLQMTPTHGHTGNEVTVCIRDERILERILATPGFPAPVSLPLYEGSTAWPIENRTIGHKGLGVVSSTRSVRADDLILAERPLMIAPLADATSWYNARYRENKIAANLAYFAEQERYFTAIVARMTPKKGMHSFRFATVSLSAAAPSLANFKRTASKFLHCLVIPRHRLQRITVILLQSANRRLASTTEVDIRTFTFQFFALRDIEPGEELTVAYCGLGFPTKSRHEQLAQYGFQCDCKRCMDP